MGAIDSMRSLALAGRAMEDMKVKQIDSVRQVNAALGTTISQAIDNLGQVANARVGAAMGQLSKMRSSLGGEGGVSDNMIMTAFILIPTDVTVTGLVTSGLKLLGSLTQMTANIAAAGLDYQNYVASIGYTDHVEADADDADAALETIGKQFWGATKLIEYRDALMPRFEYNRGPNGEFDNNGGYQGSLGTWRAI